MGLSQMTEAFALTDKTLNFLAKNEDSCVLDMSTLQGGFGALGGVEEAPKKSATGIITLATVPPMIFLFEKRCMKVGIGKVRNDS